MPATVPVIISPMEIHTFSFHEIGQRQFTHKERTPDTTMEGLVQILNIDIFKTTQTSTTHNIDL